MAELIARLRMRYGNQMGVPSTWVSLDELIENGMKGVLAGMEISRG